MRAKRTHARDQYHPAIQEVILNRRSDLTFTTILFGATAMLAPACGDDTPDDSGSGGGGQRPPRAFLIAERFNTPDGRVGYMGVFPELPSEPIEVSQLFELPSTGAVIGCNEDIFQFDFNTDSITKYQVGDDLRITASDTLLFASEGITGFTAALVCVSATQAYVFDAAATRGVEWNPQTMAIIDSFDLPEPPVPTDPPDLGSFIFEPFVAGNLVYFPFEAANTERNVWSRTAFVATFDVTDESWQYTSFEGCASSIAGYLANDGTFYLEPSNGYFFTEATTTQINPAPACMLRILAGSRDFDPNYSVVFNPPVRNAYPIDGDFMLLQRIPAGTTFPSVDDRLDWFGLPIDNFRVNRMTGAEEPYTGLSNISAENGRRISLPGRAFYQERTLTAEGRTERLLLRELLPSGASEPVITVVGGDILRLEQLW